MQVSGKLLHYAFAIGAAAVLALGTSSAFADTKTKTVGSNEGTPFTFTCPAGMALFGWGYNSTDRLTAIAPLCRPVTADGLATQGEVPPAKTAIGTEIADATTGEPIFCPDDGIMRSLQVFLTETLQVHHIRPTCKAPNHAPVLYHPTEATGGAGAAKSSVSCGSGSYAIGLIGTYSDSPARGGIISLGLVCFSGDAPKTDTTNTDTDNATPPPDSGDGGDGGPAPFNNGDGAPPPDNGTPPDNMAGPGDQLLDMGNGIVSYGAKGKARTLKDASTLYADKGNTEIAYFNKGDKLVVVACEQKGQGWCMVLTPQPGLIWGGDFK